MGLNKKGKQNVPLKKISALGEKWDKEVSMFKKPPTTAGEKTSHKIKILIADDHKLVREAFRKQIETQDDMKVIAKAEDGVEAVRLAQEVSPDVILMDINMPNMDGIQATQEIMNSDYPCCIIGLSLYSDENIGKIMLKAGAADFLSKKNSINSLFDTIRTVYDSHTIK